VPLGTPLQTGDATLRAPLLPLLPLPLLSLPLSLPGPSLPEGGRATRSLRDRLGKQAVAFPGRGGTRHNGGASRRHERRFATPAESRTVSTINRAAREINCKVVYYGPGLGGKTTNLQYIFGQVPGDHRSQMISLATEGDRTLFFDFLPLELGEVRGYKTRFHLYTVPGQVFYSASRKLILRNVDGVVFVADSQAQRLDANLEALDDLQDNLQAQGNALAELPYVLQLNKRDLPGALPVEDLTAALRRFQEPIIPGVANQGVGVLESLQHVAKGVLAKLAG